MRQNHHCTYNRLSASKPPPSARPTKSRRRAQDHALELLARVQRSQVERRRRERRPVGREHREFQRSRRPCDAEITGALTALSSPPPRTGALTS